MNILESYQYVPSSPIEFILQIKRFAKMRNISLKEACLLTNHDPEEIKYLIIFMKRYAEKIKNFIEVNNLTEEQASEFLKIDVKKYLGLLNDN